MAISSWLRPFLGGVGGALSSYGAERGRQQSEVRNRLDDILFRAQQESNDNWWTPEQVTEREDAYVEQYGSENEDYIRDYLKPKTPLQRRSAAMESVPETLRPTLPYERFKEYAAPKNLAGESWQVYPGGGEWDLPPPGEELVGPPEEKKLEDWYAEAQGDWNRALRATGQLNAEIDAMTDTEKLQAAEAHAQSVFEAGNDPLTRQAAWEERLGRNTTDRQIDYERRMVDIYLQRYEGQRLADFDFVKRQALDPQMYDQEMRKFNAMQEYSAYVNQKPKVVGQVVSRVMPDGTKVDRLEYYSWIVNKNGNPAWYNLGSTIQGTEQWAHIQQQGQGGGTSSQIMMQLLQGVGLDPSSIEGMNFMQQNMGQATGAFGAGMSDEEIMAATDAIRDRAQAAYESDSEQTLDDAKQGWWSSWFGGGPPAAGDQRLETPEYAGPVYETGQQLGDFDLAALDAYATREGLGHRGNIPKSQYEEIINTARREASQPTAAETPQFQDGLSQNQINQLLEAGPIGTYADPSTYGVPSLEEGGGRRFRQDFPRTREEGRVAGPADPRRDILFQKDFQGRMQQVPIRDAFGQDMDRAIKASEGVKGQIRSLEERLGDVREGYVAPVGQPFSPRHVGGGERERVPDPRGPAEIEAEVQTLETQLEQLRTLSGHFEEYRRQIWRTITERLGPYTTWPEGWKQGPFAVEPSAGRMSPGSRVR